MKSSTSMSNNVTYMKLQYLLGSNGFIEGVNLSDWEMNKSGYLLRLCHVLNDDVPSACEFSVSAVLLRSFGKVSNTQTVKTMSRGKSKVHISQSITSTIAVAILSMSRGWILHYKVVIADLGQDKSKDIEHWTTTIQFG